MSVQAALAALCQRQTLETHAPATVLVTRKHEYLYSLGPTERYLRVAPGHATSDVLAMVSEHLRARRCCGPSRTMRPYPSAAVARCTRAGRSRSPSRCIPILNDDEELLLIHFVDQPERDTGDAASVAMLPG